MRTHFPWLLAFLFVALVMGRAEAASFKNFQGSYSKNGAVHIFDGSGTTAKGAVSATFRIGSTGRRARLEIAGTVEYDGATRPFSVIYIFKRTTSGTRIAEVSNLAPGVDNGYSADTGTYRVSARTIKASVPFDFDTASGSATLSVRVKKRTRGTQLLVSYTLITSTLTRPITWTFSALAPL